MKLTFLALASVILLNSACSITPDVREWTLRCKAYDGECLGFYSLTIGELIHPVNPKQVDLEYYFDGDDCMHGALIGHDDRIGYLFPVGHKTWRELIRMKPPVNDKRSVDAIAPLTKDKEGLAFWVKAKEEKFYLVKIRSVQSVSYDELIAGGTAEIDLEWMEPKVP